MTGRVAWDAALASFEARCVHLIMDTEARPVRCIWRALRGSVPLSVSRDVIRPQAADHPGRNPPNGRASS